MRAWGNRIKLKNKIGIFNPPKSRSKKLKPISSKKIIYLLPKHKQTYDT
jgi:hypothetical protein